MSAAFLSLLSGQPLQTAVVHQLAFFSDLHSQTNFLFRNHEWIALNSRKRVSRRNRNETGLRFETHIWTTTKTENSLISAIIRQLRMKSRFTKKEMLISGWTQSCQATTQPIESRRWLEACNTLFIPSSTLARSIPRLCWRFIKMTNTRTEQTERLK